MNRRELAGILLFGSLWGMLECILGDFLRDQNLPAGAIMTGLVAVAMMSYTRIVFRKRGMQLGMAMVAGLLRLTNPFTGCLICSAISIVSEGIIFEAIWYKLFDLREFRRPTTIASMGMITSYLCYIGGFLVTQVLTPIVSSVAFNPNDLVAFLPQILAKGLPAGILGIFSILAIDRVRSYDISKLKSRFYYPVTISLAVVCWILTIANSLLVG